jgi:hypothetical protein
MSKIYCSTCKYYDYNTCEGVDWCRLNDEETDICGHCEREFEDLEEATEHYNAVVEEENKLYSLNCEMAGKIADLEHRLSNCIELPQGIDVGKTVYYVTEYCNEEGDELYEIEVGLIYWIEKALKVTNIAFDKNGKLKETYDGFNYTIYVRYESGLTFQHSFEDVGVWLFDTEEEAKAKLEEIQDGNL